MPDDNDILTDLGRFAVHALDVDGRTFDQFVIKAQSRGYSLADIVHSVNDVHARYVLKGKTFEPISALLYSCVPANRDLLPPKALTFKQWREAEAEQSQSQAAADAERKRREDDLKLAQEFIKRGEPECKRICAEFMQIASEFRRIRDVTLGGQLALELMSRKFESVCQRIGQGYGTALAQDAAYMECWARGTWQFPPLKPEVKAVANVMSPQAIEYERMERRLEERDGPLADAFCKREDRMARVLEALSDPCGPCSHLQAQLGQWAAEGDLNWRAATMKIGDGEVSMRPTARALLAVLERVALVESAKTRDAALGVS